MPRLIAVVGPQVRGALSRLRREGIISSSPIIFQGDAGDGRHSVELADGDWVEITIKRQPTTVTNTIIWETPK